MSQYNIAKVGIPYTNNGGAACDVNTVSLERSVVIATFYGKDLKEARARAKGCANLINEYPLNFGLNPADFKI
jgi:hypothetical protein